MGIIGHVELITDAVSLSRGQVPVSLGFRLLPVFFRYKKGLTKAQRKKLMMRRRRMFIDNIIMHHKRLHDKNREQIIDRTKAKLSKTTPAKTLAKPGASLQPSKAPNRNDSKWRNKTQPENRGATRIKGMVDNNRERSRSQWATRVRNDDSSQAL